MAELRFGAYRYDLSQINWSADQHYPKTLEALKALARRLFPDPQRPGEGEAPGMRNFDQCGEILFTRLLYAARNLQIDVKELQPIIDRPFSPRTLPPIFSDSELEVFSPRPVDLQPLREALRKVRAIRPESRIPKVHVELARLRRIRGMSAPGVAGPLVYLDLDEWIGGSPEFRLALAAHEFFHCLQYASGFRQQPELVKTPYAWFSEGTATWMEQQSGGILTSPRKVDAMAAHPEIGLRNSSYYSSRYWQARLRGSSTEMKSALERFSRDHRPDDAAGPTANMNMALDLMHRRWLGLESPPSAPVAPRGVLRTEALRPKALRRGMPVSGAIPKGGSRAYSIGPLTRTEADALVCESTGEVTVLTNYLEFGSRFVILVSAAPDARGAGPMVPFGLSIHSRSSPAPGLIIPALVPPPPVRPGVSLDSFGNVILNASPSSRAVLGFQVGGFCSISLDEPAQPAGYLDWFTTSGAPGSDSIELGISPAYESSLTRIRRTRLPSRDGSILQIKTEFDRAPSSYEAVILCGNPTATPGALLDSDGDGSMECRGGVGSDCDTDARPAWFLGFGPEYTPAEFPIVPWAGKAWLPYPGTPPDTIIEYYKIPS